MSNLDTKLTVSKIEDFIILYFVKGNIGNNIIVTNVFSEGYSFDLIIVEPSGHATGFEIKYSYSTFVSDFNERNNEPLPQWIYRFYYVLPMSTKDRVEAFFQENGIKKPAILFFDESGNITSNGAISCNLSGRRLFLEEQLQLAKMVTMMYWKLKEKQKELL